MIISKDEVSIMKEILKLDHIQKFYGNEGNVTKAIQDIDFSVQEGEFLGIMGASGSGGHVKIRLS
jgi:putative ABC transport system ATP-binding protein